MAVLHVVPSAVRPQRRMGNFMPLRRILELNQGRPVMSRLSLLSEAIAVLLSHRDRRQPVLSRVIVGPAGTEGVPGLVRLPSVLRVSQAPFRSGSGSYPARSYPLPQG